MFNFRDVRTLWSLAAIIWGVGVILAVTVLVPSAFGISVDIGVIVNGLVAIGSFAAAAAALWVATRQRQEYEQDRADSDRKQAGLVRVKAKWEELGHPDAHVLVTVRNFGSLPVVDVELTEWQVDGKSITMFAKKPTNIEAVFPLKSASDARDTILVSPITREMRTAMQGEPHPPGVSVMGQPIKTQPTIYGVTKVAVAVQFTDASEKRWRCSTAGKVTRIR
ncbi:MAG: hypothetical protein QOJ80_4315 [Mycobacterium sp.]|nr:hypothetical protein [Mycobacterium sp.]